MATSASTEAADAAMDDSGRFECTMHALQAMTMLQQTQTPFFDEQLAQAQTHLSQSAADRHDHQRAASMLAFVEGMAALQSGQNERAQQHLEQLRALERDDFLTSPRHLSTHLSVEMLLTEQADDPAAQQTARASLAAIGTPRCTLVLLQTRVAAAQGDDEAVDALLQNITERQCRHADNLAPLTRAQALRWQAERALAAGRRDDAVQLVRELQTSWAAADSSLEIHAQISALAEAISLTE